MLYAGSLAFCSLLPKLDREAPGVFTDCERILRYFTQEKKLYATFVKDLIQKGLHHPDFDISSFTCTYSVPI